MDICFVEIVSKVKSLKMFKEISLKEYGDERGSLVAIEGNNNIPFDVRRVYYIFGTKKDVERGFHAHKDLKQLLVCVSGSCDLVLDNGKYRNEVSLSSPTKGVILDSLIWREMKNFSPDCVLLVLASELYDEVDYIRDYDEFLKTVNLKNIND